jgi:hypothetical protein
MRVCARVLAAALMTGAITAGLTLPSFTGDPGGAPRAVEAPPLSHDRTLHLPAVSGDGLRPSSRSSPLAPGRPKGAAGTHGGSPESSRPVLRPEQLASTRTPVAPKPAPRPAPRPVPPPAPPAPGPTPPAHSPAPSPSPSQAAPRDVASDNPPPAAPAPQPPSNKPCDGGSDDDGHGHGQGDGNGHGHDDNQGGHGGSDDGQGHGNGNGKGNGHDK